MKTIMLSRQSGYKQTDKVTRRQFLTLIGVFVGIVKQSDNNQ
jgi:hypothetical protein